jgi:hypothetical protein
VARQDKHLPSFNGFRDAGYGWRSLCDFHALKCFEEKLKDLGIKGDSAVLLVWAFRIIKRAESVAKAFRLRDGFVRIVIAQAELAQPLWTLETAEQIISYLDRCWMYPQFILESWLDAKALTQPGYISTTSFCEASHMYWSKFMMNSLANKIVSHTIVKTVGINADGSSSTGLFPDAERRWVDAEGQPRPLSPDVVIRRARANLLFLKHNTGLAEASVNGSTLIGSAEGFDSCIHRHAESPSERRTQTGVAPPLSPVLMPMLRILALGGPGSFTRGGFHAVDDTTGRCSCPDSTYHGKLSSVGPCKHAIYKALVEEAESDSTGAALVRVQDRCLRQLMHLMHERERSKPEETRCTALYKATHEKATTTAEALLALLRRHPSIPPSGKGEQPEPYKPTESDEEGEMDKEDVERIEREEAIREGRLDPDAVSSVPVLSCVFRSIGSGLGLLFGVEGAVLCVLACVPLSTGAFGPAPHDGEPRARSTRTPGPQ